MDRNLTQKERRRLERLHRSKRDKRHCDRIKAILLYDQGYRYTEIARILLLDDETIRRHVKDYFEKHKLMPENGGRDAYLTERQSIELKSHLQEITYCYVKDICAYVKKRFGVTYTISGMRHWLHANHFCYKKPQGVPAKIDKTKQKAFIGYYRKLKKTAGNKEPIYFVDSVHPEHQTRLTRGWMLKGERKTIGMTGRQYRLNIMGGICLSNYKIVYQPSEAVNENSIQTFLYHLRKQHPGRYKVHIIWDNAGYHCSHEVRAFAKELGIAIHYLPPYSPNLNPIERLWKILHQQVTHNRYYEHFADFSEAVAYFFRHIGKKKALLRSRITDNFQLIDAPNFAS